MLAHGQRLKPLEIGGQMPRQLAFIANRAIGRAGIDEDDFVAHRLASIHLVADARDMAHLAALTHLFFAIEVEMRLTIL